jgi:hypothetical protein
MKRRDFLKGALVGFSVIVLPSKVWSKLLVNEDDNPLVETISGSHGGLKVGDTITIDGCYGPLSSINLKQFVITDIGKDGAYII